MSNTTIDRFTSVLMNASVYFCRLPGTIGEDGRITLVRALEDGNKTPESLAAVWTREVDRPVDMEAIAFAITMREMLGPDWHLVLLAEQEREWARDRWQDEGHGDDEVVGDQFDTARSRWEGDCTMFDRQRAKEADAAKRWMARASKAA